MNNKDYTKIEKEIEELKLKEVEIGKRIIELEEELK
jgi:hypothetical protein